jgi:hypothetical protein
VPTGSLVVLPVSESSPPPSTGPICDTPWQLQLRATSPWLNHISVIRDSAGGLETAPTVAAAARELCGTVAGMAAD